MTDPASNERVDSSQPVDGEDATAVGRIQHQSPELYHILVDSVRDYAICALDPKGRVMTWNQGAHRINGWTAQEILGRHHSIFYPPEDIAARKPDEELRRALEGGSSEDEGWRVRKDGSRFWANVVITVLRDEWGALVGYATVTRDLTDRRAEEVRLRESEQRIRLLVQSVRDYAIFMLDPEGRVESWNEGAQRIKGYTAEEIIGRHFSTFYPAEAVANRYPQYELKMAAAAGRFEDEGWRIRKDGSSFWASVVITALYDDKGELFGFVKVTRDLTERRRAEERAIADARRVAEMEAANRAKSDFLATLSHELRTPLNAIGGYAELLSLGIVGEINDSQGEFLQRIRTSQEHLLALVNDLLNVSRLESGQLKYDLAPVPVQRLLLDLEAMILPQAQGKGVAFEREDCSEKVCAYADAARTQQILLNLLSNAVKFTPSGGRIRVSCDPRVDGVAILVADTGPGIPADKLAAIFEPFVQIGRSLTSTREGVGLGLAISQRLARAMDGDLRVESVEGEGSTFTLTLPLAPHSSESPPPPA